MSVLANGFPTEEFGLERVLDKYADDTIFFGEWNKETVKSLMCILKSFEEVSELRVNFNNSKLYGIGVNEDDMTDMALWIGVVLENFRLHT
ncbi:hypothetical protein Tco_0268810 [Tanacetum coccineum]